LKKLIQILIIQILAIGLFGQSRAELEKKKKQTEQDIQYTNELLTKNERNKNDTYNKLILINSKIHKREELIGNISDEITFIDSRILMQQELISALSNDLENLKSEYARMIRFSYKNRDNYDRIMFILASENFNEAFKRLKYLQQYSKFRTNQAAEIIQSKNDLLTEKAELERIKLEKTNLLKDQRYEAGVLINEKNEKNSTIKKLEADKLELKKQLNNQIALANALQKEIERIIAEEIRKANERSKNKDSKVYQLTPEEKKLADGFDKNKTKLPWPTERGVITGYFGEHPHPVLKGVTIRNDGIDISAVEGTSVRAIYDGTVSRVFVLPGAHKTVIVRHGNFLSVYSNLADVSVKQGDKVKTKQIIGTIFTDKDDGNKTVLQFQIWKENVKMDPQDWLAKAKDE
jgi:murein hydrolase activator